MSDEQQPNLQWGPLEQKPQRRGRAWVIVGLVVAALVVAGVLLFFLLPRGDSPDAGASPTPSDTASAAPSAEPSEEPSSPPITIAPEPVDPTVDAFREEVGAWLSDGERGLDIVAASTGQDALAAVTILQEDAQRLSGVLPPSSIAEAWRDRVEGYGQELADLRTAVLDQSDTASTVDAARSSLQSLSELVGV